MRVEKVSFVDRIRLLLKHYDEMSVYEFSKRIGVPQPTVQGWLNQGREPRMSQIEKIVTVFDDVNAGWLLTGNGNMISHKKYVQDLEDEINNVQEQLTLYRSMFKLKEENEALKSKKN
jgi:predicted transcriptional regulator